MVGKPEYVSMSISPPAELDKRIQAVAEQRGIEVGIFCGNGSRRNLFDGYPIRQRRSDAPLPFAKSVTALRCGNSGALNMNTVLIYQGFTNALGG
jgi:hypothetical protein